MKSPCLKDSGFTLLEVLVAMVLFTMIAAPLSAAFIAHLKFNIAAEVRSGAMAAARQVLEELRLEDPALLPTSGSSGAMAINGGERTFQIEVYYCREGSFCSARSRHIEVEAKYNGKEIYTTETIFTKLR